MLQGSLEWFDARTGRITASEAGLAIAHSEAYADRLRRERNGEVLEQPDDPGGARAWGIKHEPMARAAYELRFDVECHGTTFQVDPVRDYLGASDDSLVGNDGMNEIKCPLDLGIHMLAWVQGMPEAHRPQVQVLMHVYDRAWCDFVSFHPLAAPARQLYVERQDRDPEYIAWALERIDNFWEAVVSGRPLIDGNPLLHPSIPVLF